MKLQKTSMVLWAIAGLLGGAVYMTLRADPGREAGNVQTNKLFSFQEADVQAFTVTTLTKSLAFERTTGSSPAPSPVSSPAASPAALWKMTAPRGGPANDGAIAFLLNLLATGSSQQTFKVPSTRLAEFELDRPFAKIDIKLKNQTSHRLVLGKTLFNNTGLYAQIDPPDPPPPDVTVLLVPLDFQNAVLRSEAEWQQAPPEPSPSPPPSAQPSAQPSATPPSEPLPP
jgi:hypothetical protein